MKSTNASHQRKIFKIQQILFKKEPIQVMLCIFLRSVERNFIICFISVNNTTHCRDHALWGGNLHVQLYCLPDPARKTSTLPWLHLDLSLTYSNQSPLPFIKKKSRTLLISVEVRSWRRLWYSWFTTVSHFGQKHLFNAKFNLSHYFFISLFPWLSSLIVVAQFVYMMLWISQDDKIMCVILSFHRFPFSWFILP